ncbi:hypothetical protein ASE85_03230 [Sphingobium sp. Leaf26]|uniref:hypothetical protein n=1 Tax=Sphingobium sp. Leaf26 TaxID=1735693 RepID=UPI0006F52D8B|nr:hypothetical protein [Sphingobium sp. Leaf26]KQN09956.1 hypothetical protein ASE85_03230 [Sphingobium sp. Leaf26]
MDDLRQFVTDAAVKELRTQLGDESADNHGTSVQVEGSFRMVRVADAIIRAAVDTHDPIIQEVARTLAGGLGEDWEDYRGEAADVIGAVRGRILAMLDPLP